MTNTGIGQQDVRHQKLAQGILALQQAGKRTRVTFCLNRIGSVIKKSYIKILFLETNKDQFY